MQIEDWTLSSVIGLLVGLMATVGLTGALVWVMMMGGE
jgi:hypothetical protein